MTAVVETFRKIAVMGDLKVIVIQGDATTASGYTIDLNSDIADGRGAEAKEILNTLAQDDAGLDVDGTFDPATGIYTFGTIVTGIHNISIFAR